MIYQIILYFYSNIQFFTILKFKLKKLKKLYIIFLVFLISFIYYYMIHIELGPSTIVGIGLIIVGILLYALRIRELNVSRGVI